MGSASWLLSLRTHFSAASCPVPFAGPGSAPSDAHRPGGGLPAAFVQISMAPSPGPLTVLLFDSVFWKIWCKRLARTHRMAREARETANDCTIRKRSLAEGENSGLAGTGRLGGEGVTSPYLTSNRTQQGLQCGAQPGTDFYTAFTPTGTTGHVGRGPNCGVTVASFL